MSGDGFSQQGNLGLPLFLQKFHYSRISPSGDEFGSRLGILKCEGYK